MPRPSRPIAPVRRDPSGIPPLRDRGPCDLDRIPPRTHTGPCQARAPAPHARPERAAIMLLPCLARRGMAGSSLGGRRAADAGVQQTLLSVACPPPPRRAHDPCGLHRHLPPACRLWRRRRMHLLRYGALPPALRPSPWTGSQGRRQGPARCRGAGRCRPATARPRTPASRPPCSWPRTPCSG